MNTVSSLAGVGVGIANTAATNVLGAANLQARFDPTSLGNALMSAARDGVDRFKDQTPSLSGSGSGSRAVSPPPPPNTAMNAVAGGSVVNGSGGASGAGRTAGEGNVNQNLRNIGKFFKRDLSGFSGRFGRGEEGK